MRPSINFVLHAHIPWVKGAGKWPFGEEWLFQAMLGTYIPLVEMFGRLNAAGVRGAITLGITPVLIEMLRDAYLMNEFDAYLESRVALLDDDIARFADDARLRELARSERANIVAIGERWRSVHGRDLISAIRPFVQSGEIEILTSAATHAFLPLLCSEEAIEAQIASGIETTQDAFGVRPVGIWLPECAFDPSLTPILERLGLQYFFADERAVADLHVSHDAPLQLPDSSVCYFVRHPMARGELMDTDLGYPGDEWYREFYKRDSSSGMRYWRVTGRDTGLDEKLPYEPERALNRARRHALDFVQKIREMQGDRDRAHLTLTFDAELFGHWWGEGIAWLEETLFQLKAAAAAPFELPSAALTGSNPQVVALPRSSWGIGGDDRVWLNDRTREYWDKVDAAQKQFAELAYSFGTEDVLIEQAARELFLLQSSDWPFLITNGDAGSFPQERIATHLERFEQLASRIRGFSSSAPVVEQSVANDTLFEHPQLQAYAVMEPA